MRSRITLPAALLIAVAALAAAAVAAAPSAKSAPAGKPAEKALLLKVESAPANGLIVETVDLAALGKPVRTPVVTSSGQTVASQFVPESEGSSRGTLALRLPPGKAVSLLLKPGAPLPAPKPVTGETYDAGNSFYTLQFDRVRGGGLPTRITFAKSGKVFSGFRWNERLHDPSVGGFNLQHDKAATLEVVSDGPLCTVVRASARYLSPAGAAPPTQPSAVYDWYIWKDSPLLRVAARARQSRPLHWKEHHFLELHFTDVSFTRFAGDKIPEGAPLEAKRKSQAFSRWGALVEGSDAIAMIGAPSLVYDGRGEYGTYLHHARPGAWLGWDDATRSMEGWLWIGTGDDNAARIAKAADEQVARGTVIVTSPEREERIRALRARAGAQKAAAERRRLLWHAAMAERAVRRGNLAESDTYAGGTLPSGVSLHPAGDLGMALRRTGNGLRLESLADLRLGRDLLGEQTPPLWTVTLRGPNDAEKTVDSGSGWKRVTLEAAKAGARTLTLRWADSTDPALRGVSIEVLADADTAASAWNWRFVVRNTGKEWGVGKAVFPQVALADAGESTSLLIPRGPGEIQTNVAGRGFSFSGTYPSANAIMQMLAVYHAGAKPTGLYFALHDPRASYKKLEAIGDLGSRSVRLSSEHAAPGMNKPGNGFIMAGRAVWQLLPGDWYDAARIYRDWASRRANWWPKTGPEGREDTVLWMRKGPAWAQTGGKIPDVVKATKELKQFFGVPTALHWYNWHQIPFDNDYPHYFPVKEGFTEGVADLKQSGVFVMPYINGRLWDTRDRGAQDGEFTSRALPSATKTIKDGALTPYTETYRSVETDGSPVRLAAMCPATAFWQDEVTRITTRLFNEQGVDSIYIDQVAAASPVLCMDPSHGHPLGGGNWWVESYAKMMRKIRAAMPAGRMLTTECNAEPYVDQYDGYLTWHWQNDGQVPVFPAVYGGVVQMFGRAYRTGDDKTLATRMKAAQQLAWGEQIGWADPGLMIRGSGAGDFLKRAVLLRDRLARYFYAGEMARPPRLTGTMPRVTADWQWSGKWPVTTDAVIGGAWNLPRDRRALIVLSNVSDAPVQAGFDLKRHYPALPAGARITAVALDGDPPASPLSRGVTALTLAPRSIQAWEIQW